MRIINRECFGDDIQWAEYVEAIDNGHAFDRPQIKDVFLGPPGRTLLSRAAWVKGLGFGVKSVSVMAENAALGLPTVQGAMLVFDESAGALVATIESG